MAATIFWMEDNGTKISPLLGGRGTTRTTGINNINFKNIDDTTTAYSSAPITAGNNSYAKYPWVLFSGAYNMITGVRFGRVSPDNLDAGLSIVGLISGSGCYQTPANGTISLFSQSFTTTGYQNVLVGGGGPEYSGKSAYTITNPAYSQYFGLQLKSTASAMPGDISTIGFSLEYTEN